VEDRPSDFGAPLVLVPGLAEEGLHEESLYRRLEARYGLVPQRADEEVEARLATPIERRALGSDASTVLVVRRHTWLGDGRPLEVADMIASARRYRYRVGIVREGGR